MGPTTKRRDKVTCCTYKCEQGRDCPVRKQHIEVTNQAYIERGRVTDPDPLDDVAASIKGLIAVIVVVVTITLLVFTLWGK